LCPFLSESFLCRSATFPYLLATCPFQSALFQYRLGLFPFPSVREACLFLSQCRSISFYFRSRTAGRQDRKEV
jgi:hypothetical protein